MSVMRAVYKLWHQMSSDVIYNCCNHTKLTTSKTGDDFVGRNHEAILVAMNQVVHVQPVEQYSRASVAVM